MHSREGQHKDTTEPIANWGVLPGPKQDRAAISALFLGLTIVCAVGAGALLAAGGDGGLAVAELRRAYDRVLTMVGESQGVNRDLEWASAIEAIGRDIGAVATNLDALAERVDISARSTDEKIGRLRLELSTLKRNIAVIQAVAHAAPSAEQVAVRIASLDAAISSARGDIALLQSAMDQAARMVEIDAVRHRLDTMESAMAARSEVTGSIPIPPARKRRGRVGVPGWSAQEMAAGTIVVKGPTGTFEATPGTVVPGLGRIDGIKQHGGRLLVTTSKERL